MHNPNEQLSPNKQFTKIIHAMFCPSAPVNPVPFASGLAEFVLAGGDIESDEGKAILWTLMRMAYGEFAHINLSEEYLRLSRILEN